MDAKHGSNAGEGEEAAAAALTAEEFASWTLVDRSPKAGTLKMKPGAAGDGRQPDKQHVEEEKDEEVSDEDVDEEEEDEEEDEEAEGSGSSEDEAEESEGKEDQTSGVEPVKCKPKQTKDETDAASEARDKDDKGKAKAKSASSSTSLHAHDGSSSDGISVISESDGSDHARVHFDKRFSLKQLPPSSVQLTPPLSPDREDDQAGDRSKRSKQLRRKRSQREDDNALVPDDALVPWNQTHRTTFVILGIIVTVVTAIFVGHSRIYENRASINTFNHEQRLSELELENTILKNEMTKLKHLYTRSELDEQVQQAEFDWLQTMEQALQDEPPAEPEPQPEPEPSIPPQPEKPDPPQMRKVPPQDENVRHKVVWSGDDGQPMLIADKDYVLPEFCYNKNAVKDDLFSEYSSKYCDTKQRKIDAKLKKADYYANKHNKHKHPRDYKQFIHPTAEEVAEHQKQATAAPPKVPSLSPFDFDYRSAFETIKEEGSVILQSLTAILDLDPEPELISTASSDGYLADDEASSSSANSMANNAPTTEAINWNDYPSWVREKYETQPEMYRKLQNKAALLWEWERKKNQFLDEVGLNTLEEVDRETEDALRQRRDQYKQKHGDQQTTGEWRREQSYNKHEKYDDRKGGKGGKYDERKDNRPRNGDNRSQERKDYHDKDHHKEWKDKPWRNGDKSREQYDNNQRPDYAQRVDSEKPSTSYDNSHERHSDESHQLSSDERDHRYKDKHDHRKHSGEYSKERKDSHEWKDHKKHGDHHKHKHHDSDERVYSKEGSFPKEDYKKQYKQSKEDHYHHDKKHDEWKRQHDRRHDDDDDDDDDDDRYKNWSHEKHHRNGKHQQTEWNDKHHKHKKDRYKHHENWKGEHHSSKERRR